MSRIYLLSNIAENEIDETITHLAKQNPQSAHDFIDALYDAFDQLTVNPLCGTPSERYHSFAN